MMSWHEDARRSRWRRPVGRTTDNKRGVAGRPHHRLRHVDQQFSHQSAFAFALGLVGIDYHR